MAPPECGQQSDKCYLLKLPTEILWSILRNVLEEHSTYPRSPRSASSSDRLRVHLGPLSASSLAKNDMLGGEDIWSSQVDERLFWGTRQMSTLLLINKRTHDIAFDLIYRQMVFMVPMPDLLRDITVDIDCHEARTWRQALPTALQRTIRHIDMEYFAGLHNQLVALEGLRWSQGEGVWEEEARNVAREFTGLQSVVLRVMCFRISDSTLIAANVTSLIAANIMRIVSAAQCFKGVEDMKICVEVLTLRGFDWGATESWFNIKDLGADGYRDDSGFEGQDLHVLITTEEVMRRAQTVY